MLNALKTVKPRLALACIAHGPLLVSLVVTDRALAQPAFVEEVDVVLHIRELRVLSAPGGPLSDSNPDPYVYAQCKQITATGDRFWWQDKTGTQDDVEPVQNAEQLESTRLILNCPSYRDENGQQFVRVWTLVADDDGQPGGWGIYSDEWMLQSEQFDYPCQLRNWALRAGVGGHADLSYSVGCYEKGEGARASGARASAVRRAPSSVSASPQRLGTPFLVERNMFEVNLDLDVDEDSEPTIVEVVEVIPSGFALVSTSPSATEVEPRIIDGAAEFPQTVVRWEFTGAEIQDRTVGLQVAAPPFGTPACGQVGDEPEFVARQASIAALYGGSVTADGVRYITHGPLCVQVIGSPGGIIPTPEPLPPAVTPSEVTCTAGQTTLCLLMDRFQIEVEWRRRDGRTGQGQAVEFTDRAGLFYFFNEDNLEMLIKVLDACAFNGHFWVFFAATTNVEFTVRVTDTESGLEEEYFNSLGLPAPPVQDTTAFATCP